MITSAPKRSIAWINGQWGLPKDLTLPLSDRGLQLADGLFETILIHQQRPYFMDEHINRWRRSAALLGMASPPHTTWLNEIIKEAIERLELQNSDGALRLNWSRGDRDERHFDLSDNKFKPTKHRFWLTLHEHKPTFKDVKTWISSDEYRHPLSLLNRCKTFAYNQAIQVRREALSKGADDGLILNTNGTLCCGSTANIFVQRHGAWLTPPLSDGCLPGIMREQALKRGLAVEQSISSQPHQGDQWLLINSLNCRPISQVNGKPLSVSEEAEGLWRRLLHSTPEKPGRL